MNSVDKICEEIEQDIITGALKPGEKLDEVTLANRFSTSRTPVRETLQRLTASGLVEHRPRKGSFVRQVSLYELVEMFEVMAELEGMCARLAARRITTEQSERLFKAMTTCEKAADSGNPDSYFKANSEFHKILFEASQNGFLIKQATELYIRLSPYRRLQLRVRNRIRESIAEHRAVADAIESGDGMKAEKALKAHLVIQGEKFSDLVSSFQITTLEVGKKS